MKFKENNKDLKGGNRNIDENTRGSQRENLERIENQRRINVQ